MTASIRRWVSHTRLCTGWLGGASPAPAGQAEATPVASPRPEPEEEGLQFKPAPADFEPIAQVHRVTFDSDDLKK